LTLAEPVDQHDLSIGELQGVVMRDRLALVDLSEPSHPLPKISGRERHQEILVLNIILKRYLGARQKAHRHVRLPNRSKSPR
jgi:hypothetical protein